jgi:general secretion pathway protein G
LQPTVKPHTLDCKMKALSNRKWDGVLSLVWACGGFLALRLGYLHSGSTTLAFFLLFGAWWGIAMLLAVSGLRSRSRPSVLTGLCTLLLFIGFAFWIFAPRYGSPSRPAPVTAAMTQIANLETALDAFRADNGFYPSGRNGLQDLVQQPAGAANWRGPYLDSVPKDPWGHDYVYDCPGRHTASGHPYDLVCPGPPGKSAPIDNW